MRPLLNLFYNFHWIVPGEAARSAQAYAHMLGRFLTSNGIKGVVNLRGHNPRYRWWRYESRVCARIGVAHFDAMLNSRRPPSRRMLVRLFDALDEVPRPFVIKCSGGQDRTSFVAALYLIHRGGWSAMAAAKAQFARFPYLHFPKKHQRWLKLFLDFASRDADAMPIRQWIETKYDPVALGAWLGANGYADTYIEIFDEVKLAPLQARAPKVS